MPCPALASGRYFTNSPVWHLVKIFWPSFRLLAECWFSIIVRVGKRLESIYIKSKASRQASLLFTLLLPLLYSLLVALHSSGKEIRSRSLVKLIIRYEGLSHIRRPCGFCCFGSSCVELHTDIDSASDIYNH